MSNFKLIKTAAALALGASVVTSAVVPTDASAASKYKISNGKLVIAKTGKVAKGYVTYKSLVYKDGKKLTGLKGKTYYKAGKKGTGTYKGAYYYKGAKKVTTGTYNGAYYVKGVKKVTTGIYNNRYYKSGQKATGTYKGAYYVKGVKKVTTGVYNGAYYVKGFKKVTTGFYNDVLYIKGKENKELAIYKENLFDGSKLNEGLVVFEEKLFNDAKLNKGYTLYKEDLYNNEKLNTGKVVFEGKLYEDAKLSKGLVPFTEEGKKELVYNDGELANGTFTVEGKEVAYENGIEVAAKVASVEAINVKEVKVTFNKTVSKDSFAATDFVVTKTSDASSVTVTDAQLAKDGKSATLLLAAAIPATGVDINIAEGALLTTGFDKFAKSSTTALKAADDTTAPKLLSANYVGGTDIELTFDEPVDWATNTPTVKIDQATVTAPTASTVAGKYVYTISAGSALSNGTHTVDLTNVTDFAGNKDILTSKDVVVSQDTSAAKVASIKANDSTSFIVEFSKAVALPTASNFEIKKGNLTLDSTNFTVTPALVDENGVAAAGTSSKYVKVTIADAVGNTANPLYGANESSVGLSVKVSGYKDASTVLGTEFSGSVTLAKDLTAPAIKSEKLITSTATTIVLPFTKTISSTVGTVTVKKGNVLVAQTPSASGSDNNLTLTFGAGVLEAGETYTITLAKGAVVAGGKSSESTTIQYTVPKATTLYTTTAPTIAASQVNGKNVLTLTYTGKVNDAAGLASTYKLNDAALPAGTDVYFDSSAKDKVIIELPASYAVSTENKAAKFTINADTVQYDAAVATEGSKFVSGSASSSKAYETAITLKDNVAPVVSKVEYVKNAAGLATGVKLTFSEAIKDTTVNAANFVVTQGTTPVAYTVTAGAPATADLVDDNVLNLTFTTPVTASGLVLNTNTDNTKLTLTDANGNKLGAISAISAQ